MKELKLLLGIVDEVSDYIQKNYFTSQAKFLKQYNHTNVSGDLQKGIDDLVNQKIIDLLKAANISLVIISEETGIIPLDNNPEFFLILDPIDGSNNVQPWFTPHPNLTISMGMGLVKHVQEKGLEAIDITVTKEIFSNNTYYSVKKEGAYFTNNFFKHELSVSSKENISQCPVIGIDLDKMNSFENSLQQIITKKIIVRRLGSTILDLCQVASGQYDAYISMGKRLKLTDVCQPYALVLAAGGYIEVNPFYNNESIHENFLWECLSNPQLLCEIRFNILATGTKDLAEEIKGYIY